MPEGKTDPPDRWLDGVLGPALRSTDRNPPGCDAERAAAYVEGQLAGRERKSFEAHLAGCAACRSLAATLARELLPPAREPASARRWEGWWSWRWAVPSMAAVAVIGSAVFYQWERIAPPAVQEPVLEAKAAKAPVAPVESGPEPAALPAPEVQKRDKEAAQLRDERSRRVAAVDLELDDARTRKLQTAADTYKKAGVRETEGVAQQAQPDSQNAVASRLRQSADGFSQNLQEQRQNENKQAGQAGPAAADSVRAIVSSRTAAPPATKVVLGGIAKEKAEVASEEAGKPAPRRDSASAPSPEQVYRLPGNAPLNHWVLQGSRLWAVSNGGRVFRSNDGGRSWERLESLTTADLVRIELESETSLVVTDRQGNRHRLAP